MFKLGCLTVVKQLKAVLGGGVNSFDDIRYVTNVISDFITFDENMTNAEEIVKDYPNKKAVGVKIPGKDCQRRENCFLV